MFLDTAFCTTFASPSRRDMNLFTQIPVYSQPMRTLLHLKVTAASPLPQILRHTHLFLCLGRCLAVPSVCGLPHCHRPISHGTRTMLSKKTVGFGQPERESKPTRNMGNRIQPRREAHARPTAQRPAVAKGLFLHSSFTLLPAPSPASWFSRVEMVGERKRGQVLYHWGCECLLSDRCLTDGFSWEGSYLRRLTGPSTPHGSPVFAMLTSCTVA